MHLLKGINGVAYSCSNPSINYCADWYTSEFKEIYNNSKKSLLAVKNLGFNNIRTYYLDPYKDHNDFLTSCDKLNLSVEIGISNNLLDERNKDKIKKIIDNVSWHKCVKIYTVGNEYFNNIDNIIWGIECVYSLDPNKYIMHSSIFDTNFESAKKIYLKVPAYIKPKYIVGINAYFYGNPDSEHGNVIQNVVRDYYNNQYLKDSYLIISEYGHNKDSWSAIWNFQWGNVECLKKYEKYLGYEHFSFANEAWKGSNNGENNYGIVTENGDPKSTYGAIAEFKKQPIFSQYIKSTLL